MSELTETGIGIIESRAQAVRDAVNAEGTPMGRLMAWGNGAQTIREDVPRLADECRRLRLEVGRLRRALCPSCGPDKLQGVPRYCQVHERPR